MLILRIILSVKSPYILVNIRLKSYERFIRKDKKWHREGYFVDLIDSSFSRKLCQ